MPCEMLFIALIYTHAVEYTEQQCVRLYLWKHVFRIPFTLLQLEYRVYADIVLY